MTPMDNETRQFGRPDDRGDRHGRGDDAADMNTRYLSPSDSSAHSQSSPRQYMPGEGDARYASQGDYPETQYGGYGGGYGGYDGYEPYEQPYQPAPTSEEKSGGINTGLVMAVLAFLLGLAAIAMFFLWRGAETRANKPEVPPATITQTETVTTTPSSLLDELFKRDREKNNDENPDGTPGEDPALPSLPEDFPTELPTDVPDEYRQDAEDLLNRIDEFLNAR